MAIAHLCIRCGWDLARLRPALEPHYGLRVVHCPRCRAVAVRRRHPTWNAWHQFRRIDWSLTVLAIQTVILLLLGAITTACVPAFVLNVVLAGGAHMYGPRHTSPLEAREVYWVCFWMFGVLGLVTGTWLTAGFSHLRRWKVWVSWTLFLVSLQIMLATLYIVIAGADTDMFDLNLARTTWLDRAPVAALLFLLPGVMVIFGIMMVALAGIPIGTTLLWLNTHMRRSRWRWRRRRRKQVRVA